MRSRITITISQDLLSKLDNTIDGKTIRNRSQAIESVVSQVLKPTVNTAVILAAGALVKRPNQAKKIPISLLPINTTPLIDLTLKHLKKHHFQKIIICLNKDSSAIIDHCGDGQKYGLEITYSVESKPLGTGGALKKAQKLIPLQKPFLLLHGDILTNINLTELISFYTEQGKKATIAIKPRPGRTSYGQIFLQGSKIIDFKSPKIAPEISLINTGIYLFDHSSLQLLPSKSTFKLEDTVIPKLIKQGQLTGYPFQGVWHDISSPEDYHQASLNWEKS